MRWAILIFVGGIALTQAGVTLAANVIQFILIAIGAAAAPAIEEPEKPAKPDRRGRKAESSSEEELALASANSSCLPAPTDLNVAPQFTA